MDVPLCQNVIFSTDEKVIERERQAILARLQEEYPDDDGTGPPIIFVAFSKPKRLQDDNGNQRQAPDMLFKKTPSE